MGQVYSLLFSQLCATFKKSNLIVFNFLLKLINVKYMQEKFQILKNLFKTDFIFLWA